jgi:DivIVA domain-containing protein
MRKKDKDAGDAQDFTGVPTTETVTPADIQQKEFGVSRFGGYRMRDVDEFLDHVTVSMTKLAEDNQRLRSATGVPAAPGVTPAIGAPDLAETSRQADEIIERARAEAATIVREAREQAAAMSATGGSEPTAARAAVAPFLSQERDFLQQLATLVQGHAESVKGMAKASRAAAAQQVERPPARTSPPSPAPVAETTSKVPEPRPATRPIPAVPRAAEPSAPGAREAPDAPDAPEPRDGEGASEPIRVEEPATASVGAGDPDDEGAANGDRSLRELFWGEE